MARREMIIVVPNPTKVNSDKLQAQKY